MHKKKIIAVLLIVVVILPLIFIYFQEDKDNLNRKPIVEITYPCDGAVVSKIVTVNGTATDPDGDKVYYYVDWGDGHTEDWDVPYNSGEIVSFNHSWSNSMTSYNIRAKAKDIYDAESDWAILTVQTPKNKRYYYSFLMKLLEHFPILQKLLQLPIFQQLLKV